MCEVEVTVELKGKNIKQMSLPIKECQMKP